MHMFFAIPNSEFLILLHYFARRHFSSSRHYPRVTEMRGSHSSTVSQLIPLLWPLDGSVAPSQTGSVASQRFPFAPPSTKSTQLQTLRSLCIECGSNMTRSVMKPANCTHAFSRTSQHIDCKIMAGLDRQRLDIFFGGFN